MTPMHALLADARRDCLPLEPAERKPKLTVGSLFAGIGGIELGLERTRGFETRWQVEIDPYAQKVLAKHWPDCGQWDDVRTFPPAPAEDWRVDVICGGFPCQDISLLGKREGIEGKHSGLWGEFVRIIGVLRPRYAIVENVSAILVPVRKRERDHDMRRLVERAAVGRVLGDLAERGYDAEWQVLQASDVGLHHLRERFFLVAYPSRQHEARRDERAGDGEAGTISARGLVFQRQPKGIGCPEPNLDRVVKRIRVTVDRLRCLGNSVVPPLAEYIGKEILNHARNAIDD